MKLREVPLKVLFRALLFNVFIDGIFLYFLRKVRFQILLMLIPFMTVAKTYSNILENLKHVMKTLLKWFRIS